MGCLVREDESMALEAIDALVEVLFDNLAFRMGLPEVLPLNGKISALHDDIGCDKGGVVKAMECSGAVMRASTPTTRDTWFI